MSFTNVIKEAQTKFWLQKPLCSLSQDSVTELHSAYHKSLLSTAQGLCSHLQTTLTSQN